MNTVMVKAKVKEGQEFRVDTAVQELLTALERVQPDGVHYVLCKLQDGVTFIILLAFEGEANPLATLPEFNKFQQNLNEMLAEPPEQTPLQIVGSYRVFN